MVDVKTVAVQVAQVDEAVMKALPFISGMIGFIPGGAVAVPFMPLIAGLLQVVDNAAKHVAEGDNGAAINDVLSEIMAHLTPGMPNSKTLSPPPVIISPSSADPSAQGSG
ncbi:hypothetical protein [Bradyrhizobium lablabi]|uniref:hypothetical protein n=1 Tax=Bradyrhizobium lablabi TaxID=722472 RepID=UPI001BA83673|nr:hypothetical protein [Bradyrhizobium lablabi]MBR0693695.1 hypothetical protein [Bradyrhizobium lablabi]